MPELTTFSECIIVNDDRPIRQGDIFEWLTPSLDPWQKLGLIVTGDCDIAIGKHHGMLSYVPILELTDYLAIFCLPTKVRKATSPIRDRLIKTIRTFQANNRTDFPEPISDDAAVRWVTAVAPADVADELQIRVGKERETFLGLADCYVAAERALENASFEALLDGLIQARIQNGASRPKAVEAIWSDVESFVNKLPGDAFFLGNAGPSFTRGFVAYLRLVREILQSAVATRQLDLRDGAVRAKRIAALTSPYLYCLTQQLGGVFAAIGLPTEYENARTNLVRQLSRQ